VHGRDQNNEEGLPLDQGIISKPASRMPIACSNCAKTKTKCDKKFPCSRCAARNLKCTLRPTRNKAYGNTMRVQTMGDSANRTPSSNNDSTSNDSGYGEGGSSNAHSVASNGSGYVDVGPLNCDFDSAFAEGLHVNMLEHEKPFKCSQPGCSQTQGFIDVNNLNRHIQSVHQIIKVPNEDSNDLIVR
jgi:hypothetical protein